jgi:hypothetical protein
MKLYIVWAMPKNSNDRLDEKTLTSMALTAKQVEKVKEAASKDGWHGFRVVEDSNEVPDFTKGINL